MLDGSVGEQEHVAQESGAGPSRVPPGTAPEAGVWSRLAHDGSVPSVVAISCRPSHTHAGLMGVIPGTLVWDQDCQAGGGGLEGNPHRDDGRPQLCWQQPWPPLFPDAVWVCLGQCPSFLQQLALCLRSPLILCPVFCHRLLRGAQMACRCQTWGVMV